MKRYAIFFILSSMAIFSLYSCSTARQQTEEMELQAWLSSAKRPVQVTRHNPNNHFTATRANHYYTLIDQEGKVYLAKNVRYELPEIIP